MKFTPGRSGLDSSAFMVIPETYRKCVVFLFTPTREPAGTAFIAGVPAAPPPNPDGWFVRYLVTARHMVGLARTYGALLARINLVEGGSLFVELPAEKWHEHSSTEVAAVLLRGQSKPMDNAVIPIGSFELEQQIGDHRISIGDEVFFMGLFSEHPGEERNEPIARFGNIALMPGEKVTVEVGDSTSRIRAFLVEARSWGGHSGSPAFVYFPADRFGNSITLNTTLPIFFLGLVQGHYNAEHDAKFLGDRGTIKVNAGIAVVVPAQDVYDLLMSEDVVAERGFAIAT